MIKHYLKVAFRNLIKYKTQSLVSIIGLAVGFTCFALSVLWIRMIIFMREPIAFIWQAVAFVFMETDLPIIHLVFQLIIWQRIVRRQRKYVVYFMTGMKKRLRMRMLSLWYDVQRQIQISFQCLILKYWMEITIYS